MNATDAHTFCAHSPCWLDPFYQFPTQVKTVSWEGAQEPVRDLQPKASRGPLVLAGTCGLAAGEAYLAWDGGSLPPSPVSRRGYT